MANDEQQEGLSAQERLARLYSARAEGQQEDATSFAGETAGVSISSEVPQAQTVSTQERLDRLRARRAGVPLPGDPEAATPVNNEGANRPRFNINLSRIVDAIPTIVRFFPLRIFTVWGLCSVWHRMYLNTGGDDVLHTGLPAPGYSAFNPFALGAVVFIGLLVVLTEIIAGPLSMIIKQLIIGVTYFFRGSAATREARDRAHANSSLRRLVTETVRGYHSGYSVFGSMARAARGARNSASTLDYGVGAFTGEDPNAPVYDDGLGDRPSQMELTDDAASRIWDLYYPAYGAEGPMSNLHEALAAGDPQDYTTLMSLALNVAEWCEQNGTPDTHGWFDDPAYPGDYVDAGTFYLMAYSFWEHAAEARRVGPIEPLADDMSRFILRHLSDWSRENAHAYRWRGDWRDADYFDKDRL